MRSVKLILSVLLLATACFMSFAQGGTVDDYADKISGTWYNTRNIDYGGNPVFITPSASDSLMITRMPGTNNIFWKQYEACRLVEEVTYLITWSAVYDDWVLKYNEYELFLEFDQSGFKAYMGPENTPYYTRIDTFTLHDFPGIISTIDGMHCGIGEVSLEAVSNVGAVNWYINPEDEFAVDTGNTFITPVISNNTVYYARANDNGCMSPEFIPVFAKIKDCNRIDSIAGLLEGRWYVTFISGGIDKDSTPVVPVGGDSVIVSRNIGIDIFSWVAYQKCDTLQSGSYEIVFDTMLTRAGQSWMLVNAIHPNLIIESATHDSLSLAMDVIDGYHVLLERIDTFTLHNPPSVTGIISGSLCGPGEVRLEAIANPGVINWYADSTGEEVIASGNTFITPFLSATTVFYVESVEAGCKTSRVAVTAVISDHESCLVNNSDPAITVGFKLYPNPSAGKFEILADESFCGKSIVEVYNEQGSLILKKSFGDGCRTFKFDLTNQQDGLYFVNLKTSKGVYILKVIKSDTRY